MPSFHFPRLTRADLPQMHRWLGLPHVAAWWGEAPTLEAVEHEYGEYIDGIEPVQPYLVLLDDVPIGHAQWMRYADYAWYARILGIEDLAAANCDVFIGDPDRVHRGLGAEMVRQFVDEVIFADPSVTRCYIDPDARNHIAIRAYEKAGFRFVRAIEDDGEGHSVWLMERGR